jgi:hypothetical protein
MRKESAAIVSIASIVCVLSSFVARAQSPTTSTQAKVLHLTASHIVIDQPGTYVLDRHWQIPGEGVFYADGPRIIEITANDVVLDLEGFTIDMPDPGAGGIYIGGANVTLRNGKITAAVTVDGASGVIDALDLPGAGVSIRGPDGVVRDSSMKAVSAGGDHFLIVGNRFDCDTTCVFLRGNRGVFRNNNLYRGGSPSGRDGVLFVSGSSNTIENNYLESVELNPAAIFVQHGNRNLIARNTMVKTGLGGATAIQVESGNANVIDGNIASHTTPPGRWEFGIIFVVGANGNFFGNNRMQADDPFFTGSGLQEVDWGGNVGYAVTP